MNSGNDKSLSREEIEELIESRLDDYLSREEAEELIEKKIQDHERKKREMRGLWKDDKPFPP